MEIHIFYLHYWMAANNTAPYLETNMSISS